MKKRFEPNCQTEIYWRKFQARLKQSDETWHDFADDLHGLVDKAIPDVQEEARQQLAVMRYLEQLSDTQFAFSVRQKRPKTLAEAVALTLEMESLAIASGVSPCKESPRLCMAGTQTTTDINAQGLLTTLLQRMGKLEDTLAEARMHMGKRNDVQEGHAHSATPVLPILIRHLLTRFQHSSTTFALIFYWTLVLLSHSFVEMCGNRLTRRNSNS